MGAVPAPGKGCGVKKGKRPTIDVVHVTWEDAHDEGDRCLVLCMLAYRSAVGQLLKIPAGCVRKVRKLGTVPAPMPVEGEDA